VAPWWLLEETLRGNDYDFETAVHEIGTLLEGVCGHEILQVRLVMDRKNCLVDGVNQVSIVNFVVMGRTRSGPAFSDDALPHKRLKLPFFINMTCLNGFFHDLYTESLAEALMEQNKVELWLYGLHQA
jgi:hypothetical protein